MDFSNPDNLIKRLPDYFLAENADGINSTITVSLIDESDQAWTIRIKDKKCTVEPGRDPKAALSLAASPESLKEIISGKLDPARAFMQGKVRFSGNINLAMRFSKLFNINALRH